MESANHLLARRLIELLVGESARALRAGGGFED